jgi:glycosyltransferase involved in cell wall biosynthesis
MVAVTKSQSARPVFSIVVPAFNEERNLLLLHARIAAVMQSLGERWELVFVNDGSRDSTLEVMHDLRDQDHHVAIVNLSRNFGKEIATTAGLDHARGEAVIVTDADLQDPPEVIPELIAAWRRGFDTVYAQRCQRHGETWLKRVSATAFYRVLRRSTSVPIPPDTGDFRLMSRRVVHALSRLRERHRFMKGLSHGSVFPAAPSATTDNRDTRVTQHGRIGSCGTWRLKESPASQRCRYEWQPISGCWSDWRRSYS